MTNNLRFVRALIATNLKGALALRGSFWLQVTFMMVNNFSFFVFWWVLFGQVGSLRGWVVSDVELLYGLSAVSFGLVQTFAGGVRHISRWVDEGELDSLLSQPKPTWLYAVGSRSQPSGLGDVLSGVPFLVMSGYARLDTAPIVLLCVLCGATIYLGAGLAFFSLAFWLRRTDTFSRQLFDLVILLSLYPESLFGGALRLVLYTVIPAGFICYVPVHVLRDGALIQLPMLVCAAASFLALGIWIFGRGLRRYTSGSRFGIWG
jgi:ABC-2 type transport system permease protein